MEIREAKESDEAGIWEIFRHVVAAGDTYVFPVDSSRGLFRSQWMKYAPFVAVEGDSIAGTYIVKPNQMGLGDHIANGSYMVHPDFRRRGVGKALGLHSIGEATRRGFKAMQFNLVVSTNVAAVSLWQAIGFRIVGTVPKAFRHRELGFVDAHVMYLDLQPGGW